MRSRTQRFSTKLNTLTSAVRDKAGGFQPAIRAKRRWVKGHGSGMNQARISLCPPSIAPKRISKALCAAPRQQLRRSALGCRLLFGAKENKRNMWPDPKRMFASEARRGRSRFSLFWLHPPANGTSWDDSGPGATAGSKLSQGSDIGRR